LVINESKKEFGCPKNDDDDDDWNGEDPIRLSPQSEREDTMIFGSVRGRRFWIRFHSFVNGRNETPHRTRRHACPTSNLKQILEQGFAYSGGWFWIRATKESC
jgi:hypothetical protein